MGSDFNGVFKKDIFTVFAYEFEPSHHMMQYKTPEQKEEEYALKTGAL